MKRLLANPALRPAMIYAVLSACWILFSDRIAEALFRNPDTLSAFQTYKGLAFVAATTWLVSPLGESFVCQVLQIVRGLPVG